jgi:hypothetical protein
MRGEGANLRFLGGNGRLLNQMMANGQGSRFRAAVYIQLPQNVANMRFNRRRTYHKLLSDLGIIQTLDQQFEYLMFTFCQVSARCRWPRGRLNEPLGHF